MSLDTVLEQRQHTKLTDSEIALVSQINKQIEKMNVDNISRTKAYQDFYFRNREILWSFLASMVSRNAGWNMVDLHLKEYRQMLSPKARRSIFYTYERANWLIFSDAFPQLLVYEASKNAQRPLFYLLKEWKVSAFMELEWNRFWYEQDRGRIDIALIINEQNLIQHPVLEHPEYRKDVFSTLPFWLQERFHFSTVLFPTLEGDLFGISVYGFKKLNKRINVGKKLLQILSNPAYQERFETFAMHTEPTGARNDFERYLSQNPRADHRSILRMVYPIIRHERHEFSDWSLNHPKVGPFFREMRLPKQIHLNDWYEHKRMELSLLAKVKSHLIKKRG